MRLASFPPLETASHLGVTVGASHGAAGRANAAQFLNPDSKEPEQAIWWATEWLTARELIPLLRVTPLTPAKAVEALDTSSLFGKPVKSTVTMHMNLAGRPAPSSPTDEPMVEIVDSKPNGWLSERDLIGATEVEALMAKVDGHVGWAVVRDTTAPTNPCVAVGRGIAVGEWLSIQAMFTNEANRGKGLARGILDALHRWGESKGATKVFLDVLASNEAAQGLYQRFGYTSIYSYHYRYYRQSDSSNNGEEAPPGTNC